MIHIKTPQEVEKMAKGGHILAEVLDEILAAIKPGVTEIAIDTLAETLIRKKGGLPAFQRVPGYIHTICASTNDVVVHGIPSDYQYQDGDVAGIDCGVYYQGFNTDMAGTIRVGGSKGDKIDTFLATGEKALTAGIAAAQMGNRIGNISQAIQQIVEGAGYSVVRSLIGHGVGRDLHEEPEVPGYLARPLIKTPLLKEGMTIAVEVIYTMGKPGVIYAGDDGWTIKSEDNSMAGLFERTIVITPGGPVILTK